jgi:hypothetical protein
MGHRGLLRVRAAWLGFLVLAIVSATATSVLARGHPRHVRPGCSQACRNLGGLGAGGVNKHPRIAVLAKRVQLQGNVAPIPMRCLARKRCRGILLMDAVPPSPTARIHQLSRVDLDIPARTELVIEVTLSQPGLRYVRAHSPVRAYVTVVYSNPHIPIDTLSVTLVAPRASPALQRATSSTGPVRLVATRRPRRVRPGCGAACRNLGSAGGSGPGAGRMSVGTKTVRVAGRVVPIPLHCLSRAPCKGAVRIMGPGASSYSSHVELARADLNIPGHTELIVEVTLPRNGVMYVRNHKSVRAYIDASYLDRCGLLSEADLLPFTLVASTAAARAAASGPVAGHAAGSIRRVRPGCGPTCRNLEGPPPPPPGMLLLGNSVRLQGNVVPISLRCVARQPCQGVLQLLTVRSATTHAAELARVDLNVPSRTELIVEVSVSPLVAAYVRAQRAVSASLSATYRNGCGDGLGGHTFAVTILA